MRHVWGRCRIMGVIFLKKIQKKWFLNGGFKENGVLTVSFFYLECMGHGS